MKEQENSSILFFIFPQLLCILTYLLLVALLWSQNLATEHYWYAFPVLIFFYIPLYYLLFWYPKDISWTQFFYQFINIILFIICSTVFFGVYFGLFYYSMRYNLHKIKDCQVIGRQSAVLGGYDNYSILYVDFNEDGHNMLGYACLSSTNNNLYGTNFLIPDRIYKKNESYFCTDYRNSTSFQIPKTLLQNKRNRNLASRRSSRRFSQSCYYTFSNTKLPDWMCQNYQISFEDLAKKQDCYVHYYKGDSTREQAYQNSQKRYKIKDLNEFAMVTFSQLVVPLYQFMMLLILIFCPMIMSLNVVYNQLTKIFIKKITKLKIKLKQYLQCGLIKKIQMLEYQKKLTNQSNNLFIKKVEKLNVNGQGSPMILNINTSQRQYLQKDFDLKPLNLIENNNQKPETDQIKLEVQEFNQCRSEQSLKENKHLILSKALTFQDKVNTEGVYSGKSKYRTIKKVEEDNKQFIKSLKSNENDSKVNRDTKQNPFQKSQSQKINDSSSSSSNDSDKTN